MTQYVPQKTMLVNVTQVTTMQNFKKVLSEVEMLAEGRPVFASSHLETRGEEPMGFDIFQVDKRGFAQGLIFPPKPKRGRTYFKTVMAGPRNAHLKQESGCGDGETI